MPCCRTGRRASTTQIKNQNKMSSPTKRAKTTEGRAPISSKASPALLAKFGRAAGANKTVTYTCLECNLSGQGVKFAVRHAKNSHANQKDWADALAASPDELTVLQARYALLEMKLTQGVDHELCEANAATLRAENEELKRSYDELARQNKELDARRGKVVRSLEEEREKHNARERDLSSKWSAARTEAETLKTEYATLEAEYATMKKDLEAAKAAEAKRQAIRAKKLAKKKEGAA